MFAEVSTDDLSSRYGVDGRVEFRELIEDVLELLARAARALALFLVLLGRGMFTRVDNRNDNNT